MWCVSFSLLFTVHFSCIPNKELLAERWTGGVLAGGLFRKRRTNERERDGQQRQWLGAPAAQKIKKPGPTLRGKEKKESYVSLDAGETLSAGIFKSPFVFRVDLRNVDKRPG